MTSSRGDTVLMPGASSGSWSASKQRYADEAPGVGLDAAEEAILAELEAEFDLQEAEIDADTLALAKRLEQRHLA